jgi:hypothetical protein
MSPAASRKQQRLFGWVHAVQKGKAKNPPKQIAEVAESIDPGDAKDFASTKHEGLPEKKEAGSQHTERAMPAITKESAHQKMSTYLGWLAKRQQNRPALTKLAALFAEGKELEPAIQEAYPGLKPSQVTKLAKQLVNRLHGKLQKAAMGALQGVSNHPSAGIASTGGGTGVAMAPSTSSANTMGSPKIAEDKKKIKAGNAALLETLGLDKSALNAGSQEDPFAPFEKAAGPFGWLGGLGDRAMQAGQAARTWQDNRSRRRGIDAANQAEQASADAFNQQQQGYQGAVDRLMQQANQIPGVQGGLSFSPQTKAPNLQEFKPRKPLSFGSLGRRYGEGIERGLGGLGSAIFNTPAQFGENLGTRWANKKRLAEADEFNRQQSGFADQVQGLNQQAAGIPGAEGQFSFTPQSRSPNMQDPRDLGGDIPGAARNLWQSIVGKGKPPAPAAQSAPTATAAQQPPAAPSRPTASIVHESDPLSGIPAWAREQYQKNISAGRTQHTPESAAAYWQKNYAPHFQGIPEAQQQQYAKNRGAGRTSMNPQQARAYWNKKYAPQQATAGVQAKPPALPAAPAKPLELPGPTAAPKPAVPQPTAMQTPGPPKPPVGMPGVGSQKLGSIALRQVLQDSAA